MAQMPVESVAQPDLLVDVEKEGKFFLLPFVLVTSLFFLWGMVHNLDSILIPHLKKACELTNIQSMLIDTAIFLAYFLMAIPAGMVIKKWGYKKGIIAGLLVAVLGASLFVPAANTRIFELFLLALFIIGCGIATLETAANPYAAVLGPPATAGIRLNLSAAINGLAVFVAPMVGTLFILSGKEQSSAMTEAERRAYLAAESHSVVVPYLCLCGGLLLVALLFALFHFPEVRSESKSVRLSQFGRALRHRHVAWAVVAQFAYVGAQVCVTSTFIRMAQQGAHVDEKTAGWYLATVYGTLFLAGRFIGTFLLKYVKQQKLLTLYAVLTTLLCAAAIAGKGQYVVYCLGAVGFFMSIMFPTIFSLGLVGLGEETKPASALLVMAIVGGAVFPPIMGFIIDRSGDRVQPGYIVPLFCFLVIIYFGMKGYKPREQEKPVLLD